jgi:hypothetical protein
MGAGARLGPAESEKGSGAGASQRPITLSSGKAIP